MSQLPTKKLLKSFGFSFIITKVIISSRSKSSKLAKDVIIFKTNIENIKRDLNRDLQFYTKSLKKNTKSSRQPPKLRKVAKDQKKFQKESKTVSFIDTLDSAKINTLKYSDFGEKKSNPSIKIKF